MTNTKTPEVGTIVKFAGLTATVVANYDGPNYPRTRIQYRANGGRETVATDALTWDHK